jgi:hypothetical protein
MRYGEIFAGLIHERVARGAFISDVACGGIFGFGTHELKDINMNHEFGFNRSIVALIGTGFWSTFHNNTLTFHKVFAECLSTGPPEFASHPVGDFLARFGIAVGSHSEVQDTKPRFRSLSGLGGESYIANIARYDCNIHSI